MIYNTGVKFGKIIESPTQEEIYSCPHYFAFSKQEIFDDKDCPPFLKRLLDEFPFDGRNNVVQVRPQDFRTAKPPLIGDHWHTDVMVRLNDNKVRCASSINEFHLMVASWGGVTSTEFMFSEFEAPDILGNMEKFGALELLNKANAVSQISKKALDGELVEYTSGDIHRVSNDFVLGKMRLIVVAFDCDSYLGGGQKLQSIKEKDGNTGATFQDNVL